MSNVDVATLVQQIHDAPLRIVLAITGGGSRAISALLEMPGASRTVLEATVPYCAAALVDWIKAKPEHFCSECTARAMAMAGYQRALKYSPNSADQLVAGVACTASLVSDRHKHGAHRIHIALQSAVATQTWSLVLHKGTRNRAQEEAIAARLVLNSIAQGAGLESRLPLSLQQESIVENRCDAPEAWQRLLAGTLAATRLRGTVILPKIVFPGAFNPLHPGHRAMAKLAARRLSAEVAYELSIVNADKPPIDFIELDQRARQFADNETLWLTHASTFVEKSAIFPGAAFLVGVDTIERIAEPRFYGDNVDRCRAALDEIAGRGCRFLVFGRAQGQRFLSLSDLTLPGNLAAICDEVPAAEFREDVSSTELRKRHSSP